MLAGCAELSLGDGTSVSVGKPSGGYLLDGAKLPDHGVGFFTRPIWRERNNRYGTDELIALIVGVAGRQARRVPDARLVVADLSGKGGGGGEAFHRSHQSGRDADLLYFERDGKGKPFEPDAMRIFDGRLTARDGSGITIDVPRTWMLVRDLLTAPEANVQWIFCYQPIANTLIDYGVTQNEPPELIARARLALKQPSDSARHDDHLHVRVYCTPADRDQGCLDFGPRDMMEGWHGPTLPPELGVLRLHKVMDTARSD